MRVYVESNFVLEVALEQKQHAACDRIMLLAQRRKVSLAIPAYALLEPVETLARRIALWSALGRQVDVQLGELRRTVSLQAEASALVGLAIRASSAASTSLEKVRNRILRLAEVIPTDASVLRKAERMRKDFGLEAPDAVMLASVLLDRERSKEPGLFLNTNTKDFADASVRAALTKVGCEVLGSFEGGRARIEHLLRAKRKTAGIARAKARRAR